MSVRAGGKGGGIPVIPSVWCAGLVVRECQVCPLRRRPQSGNQPLHSAAVKWETAGGLDHLPAVNAKAHVPIVVNTASVESAIT